MDIINQIREVFEDIELFNRICSKFKINQFQYKLFEGNMINYSFNENGYIWCVECNHHLKSTNIQNIFCATIMGENHFNLDLNFNSNRKKYYIPNYSKNTLDIKFYNTNEFLNQLYDISKLNINILEYPNDLKMDKSYFKKYQNLKTFKLFSMDIPQEKSTGYFGFDDNISFYCDIGKYWC